MQASSPIAIRWLIRRDLPEVLQIENGSFDDPWTEAEFLEVLKQRNCIGMVAELSNQVVGYMIYELKKTTLRIMSFAVSPKYRRMGIGKAMFQRLKDKLSQQKRSSFETVVKESSLDALLFFKSQGMRAVKIHKDYYVTEDGYRMRFSLKDTAMPVNRISAYFSDEACEGANRD
ncbi:MAG: GNAT family N-acetyltransferase [Desulfurellales bacterium]|nr:MAG: GNAT family N-acetyltransferase [Desulfurellales bacterium]